MRGGRWLWMAVVLSGCVRFQPRPLSPADTAQAFAARQIEDAGLRQFVERAEGRTLEHWPPSAWGLRELTLAALYFNPELAVARSQWDVARAAVGTAGQRPNPSLTIAPGLNTTTRTPAAGVDVGGLELPIETAGKRGLRRAQATHLAEAARLSVLAEAWRVRGRVRAGLLALHAARERRSLLEEQESLWTENVRILELQRQAGEISPFEATQGRIAADNARLAASDGRQRELEARSSLAEAVGVPLAALEATTFAFDALDATPDAPTLGEARTHALQSRADLLAALAEYAASQSGLQLEIAKQYPDFRLGPGYEYDQGDHKWSLGLSLELPVFSRNRGAIKEALARRAEAAARFNALQAQVTAEIDRALAAYRAADEKRATVAALVGRLEQQAATARVRLAVGEISKGELLGLELERTTQALVQREAVTQAQQALGTLEEALQGTLGVTDEVWQTTARTPPEDDGRGQR